MQTRAMGRQLVFTGRFAPPSGQGPLALVPLQALLPVLLDAPLPIVVLSIVGVSLPVHCVINNAPASRRGIFLWAFFMRRMNLTALRKHSRAARRREHG